MIYDIWEKKDECKSISEVSARNFGLKDLSAVDTWKEKFERNTYFIYNMDKAVSVVRQCISEGYKFAILGDYDADGITGTAILTRGLISLGVNAKDIQITIPDRITEGYGASAMHVDRIKASDTDKMCLLFVDNGIAAEEALNRAKERGFKTVILDHHMAASKDVLDLADVIVDPEAEETLYGKKKSDFDSYCGAGLAFSFMRDMGVDNSTLYQLLCFAAIGTVCDVMPLREENFFIVRYGLQLITQQPFCPSGLYALTCALNLYGASLSAKDLGFSYGPVINAQSRMKGKAGVIDVLKLFLYNGDYRKKMTAAERLIAVNDERKRAQNTGVLIAERLIKEQGIKKDMPLVLYIPDINEGIVGIIAGKLAEEYHIPSYVLTDAAEDGVIKGSGRSYGNYDMSEALESIRPVIISGGGHSGACGLSLEFDNLDKMKQLLSANFPSDYVFKADDTLYYDLEIEASDIDKAIAAILPKGPFGEGHKEIVFKVDNFRLIPAPHYVNILSDGSSAKLIGEKASAFAFKMADGIPEDMRCADIVGTLSESYFKGRKSYRVEVIDIKDKTEKNAYKETELAAKLRQMG